jgi:uncharacterized membrane protein YkoI
MIMSTRFARTIERAGRNGLATIVVAVAALLVLSHPAAARPRAPAASIEVEAAAELFPAQRGGGISLAQATAMAQSRYQGRVVRAETVQAGDRMIHEIRILGDDGRVRTVRIDAQTGSFL